MTAYPGGDTAVNGMLQGAWRGGVRSFWMVGTGDLRPSLMELNQTGALWCTPDTDCAAQRTAYLRCTYRAPDGGALTDSALEDLSVRLRARAESAVQAGSPPQPVGEAFLTRSTRLFASAWLCGKTQGPIQELAALLPAESYAEQLAAYQQLCTSALENYETLLPGCSYAGRATTPLWQEQVVFSVRLYLYALRGAVRFCTAREQFLDKDWQNCFCTGGGAADDFGAMAALLQPKTGFGGWLLQRYHAGRRTHRPRSDRSDGDSPRGRGRAGLCRLAGSTAWCPGGPRAGFYPIPRPGAGGNEKSVRAGPKMHRKIHVLPAMVATPHNPAQRLKHRSGGCGTASALPKCSIMSGCGTRIVLRGAKAPRTLRPLPCFGSLFPPLAALTFAASSIICAFGLAAAAPRSPYRHLELCGSP